MKIYILIIFVLLQEILSIPILLLFFLNYVLSQSSVCFLLENAVVCWDCLLQPLISLRAHEEFSSRKNSFRHVTCSSASCLLRPATRAELQKNVRAVVLNSCLWWKLAASFVLPKMLAYVVVSGSCWGHCLAWKAGSCFQASRFG